MQVILSTISAGGLLGAGNQYLCLLILAIAAKTDLVHLSPEMSFIESWWFIGIVTLFWIVTVAPAYASLLGPGVMNVINTVANLLSGLAVPVSAALLALAAAGVIAEMNPTFHDVLVTLQIFDGKGIGKVGLLIAGGSALTASALTGTKFLAKPAMSAATGTTGSVSAPIYATIENAVSIVVMALLYVLSRINPWLLVVLLAVVTLVILAVLIYAVYQLWKLGKGIGRVFHLIETNPKAGLSVVAEFFVWGAGWLIWKQWNRGVLRLTLWAAWLLLIFAAIPAAATALGTVLSPIPPLLTLIPAFLVMAEAAVIFIGLYFGLRSAGGLLKTLEQTATVPHPTQQPSAA